MKKLYNLTHPPSYWDPEDHTTRCSFCDDEAQFWFEKHSKWLCESCVIQEMIDANIIEEL